MSTATVGHATLVDTVWRESENTKWIRFVVLALVGALAMTIAAKIKIPFYPVHMTMQTFVLLAMSMALGWRIAGAAVLVYLAEGALGLPVFTGTPERGIGIAYMMGPTGGYLIGFWMAALVVGYLAEKGWDRSVFRTAAAMLIGNVVIYVPGLLYLGALLGWENPILEWGFTPFIYADLLKLALAAALLPLIWRMLGTQK